MTEIPTQPTNGTQVRLAYLERDLERLAKEVQRLDDINDKLKESIAENSKLIARMSERLTMSQIFQAAFSSVASAIATILGRIQI